ncbi:hypothetical protein SeLEV6574_g05643 [Synchytrium endobioticum]|uniref:Iron-binding zinc finger CDGSH type domain-containing protein n=1 Tax=Synchytrium endobioticum TaxID=286115 RepID=A0A507CTE2_9FUNG|nr:hypothetical protein SeLEV6574_g05643 [Synchytrium endobioticum]
MDDVEDIVTAAKPLKPCVALYGPYNVRDLQVGQVKWWCQCGLSKKQPWCDNSHTGTGFKPVKWVVPGTVKDGKPQTLYSLCGCKYTTAPPYCNADHIHLPMQYLKQIRECSEDHEKVIKLCTVCGYTPPTPAE